MARDFCSDCGNYNKPDYLKKMYERYVWTDYFESCPLNNLPDSKFAGCTRKNSAIDWGNFEKWLEGKGVVPSTTS